MILYFKGENCPKCDLVAPVLEGVFRELGYVKGKDYLIKHVDEEEGFIEALQYQVTVTPALVVDGELCFSGEVFTREQLLDKIRNSGGCE